MPRGNPKNAKHDKGHGKARSTRSALRNPIANVNSNHSTASSRSRNDRIKSKSVKVIDKHRKDCESINPEHTEVIHFGEDGDTIQMEINDGGAAA